MRDAVSIERHGAVLEIVLDRPPVNAIDAQTSRALSAAFVLLRDDPNLRAGIITGEGDRFFSAGWDLKAEARGENQGGYGEGGFAGLTELFDLEKPVIAAVNGMAVGGGFELVLACDMAVAAEKAEFFLPEVTLGLVANAGGVFRLPRRMPEGIAMELLLTGRRMPAAEARSWGLVNAVVPRVDVMATARRIGEQICSAAPLAIRACKEMVRKTSHLSVQAAFGTMRSGALAAYECMLASADFQEGPRAFAEKRLPEWSGR